MPFTCGHAWPGSWPESHKIAGEQGRTHHGDIADIAGSVTPGKSADIIAVDGDPLGDITELERVTFVMAQGVRATAEALS